MEVTLGNYEKVFHDFKRDAQLCEFCAIDQEMTGGNEGLKLSASAEEMYGVKRETARRYTAFQIGITFFIPTPGLDGAGSVALGSNEETPERKEYEVRPYNFFVRKSDGCLVLSASVVKFLAANKADFQTWLTAGIPYFNAREEEQIQASMAEEQQRWENPVEWVTSEQVPEYMEAWIIEMEKNLSSASDELEKAGVLAENDADSSEEERNESEPCYSFDLKLDNQKASPCISTILNGLYRNHPLFSVGFTPLSSTRQATRGNAALLKVKVKPKKKWMDTIVSRANTVEGQPRDKTSPLPRCENIPDNSSAAVSILGFRVFWKTLIASQKPIVGHNFLDDLMFLIQMHECDLPEDLETFKAVVRRTFPAGIWDTKVMSTEHFTGRTDLQSVCDKVLDDQRFENRFGFHFPKGLEAYRSPRASRGEEVDVGSAHLHNGAFDAYLTGIIFMYFSAFVPDLVRDRKDSVQAFGSRFLTNFQRNKDDEPLFPFPLTVTTRKTIHYDDFRSEINSLLRKESPSTRSKKPITIRSLMSNSFDCTKHFFVSCENENIQEVLLNRFDKGVLEGSLEGCSYEKH